MSKKLTLNEKKLLNKAVTGETKRCLALVTRHFVTALKKADAGTGYFKGEDVDQAYDDIMEEIVKGCPYIEFHPELLKRIPK